jgi:hypothetical protein
LRSAASLVFGFSRACLAAAIVGFLHGAVLRAVSAAALLAAGALAPNLAFAQATKSNVCHVTGNGGLNLLTISSSALRAHLAHGDKVPGDSSATGPSYPGLYGSTVTPLQVIGDDCSTSNVLRIDVTVNFAGTGWAGWSCVEQGYPKVVGGGFTPDTATITAQGAAKFGAAAVAGYNYPVYPHYTFNGGVNAPSGEEGWVVQAAAPTPPTGLYVLCGQ